MARIVIRVRIVSRKEKCDRSLNIHPTTLTPRFFQLG